MTSRLTQPLDEFRVWANSARHHNDVVERSFVRARASVGPIEPVITRRCQLPHKRGRPKLAQVFAGNFGVLFVSRIEWLPSDQLNLRPWQLREDLIDCADLPDSVADDRRRTLLQFDHVESDGPRWLQHTAPFWVHDDLAIQAPSEIRPQLWVRCQDHPEAAAPLDGRRLLREARGKVLAR